MPPKNVTQGKRPSYEGPLGRFERFLDGIFGTERHDEPDAPHDPTGPQPQPRSERQPQPEVFEEPEREFMLYLNDNTIIYKDQWETLLASMQANKKGYDGYAGDIKTSRGLLQAINGVRTWESAEGGDFGGFVDDTEGGSFEDELLARIAALGGGGGGRAGPVYKAPDEATVREGLALYVSTVVGQGDDATLNEAVRIFMSSSKANFNSKGKTIDATTAAKNYVRSTAAYKDIHELRPENMDELRWVTSTQGQLRKLGVSGQNAEQLGIELARAAASGEGIQKAGETAFQRQTGRIHDDQRNRLKSKAAAAAGLL